MSEKIFQFRRLRYSRHRVTTAPMADAARRANDTLVLPQRSFTSTWVFSIFSALLALMSMTAAPSNAERPRTTLCAEKLQKFVGAIDELLAKNVLQDEPFWAVIREYLPAKGCTVEEVISISKASKFFEPPFEQYAVFTISFKNANKEVFFGLQKDTGNIEYPAIGSTHLPSW
jgi:hypothetical protein